jgi:hypothetical protein
LWSFAGDSDRLDVNQLLLRPIVGCGLGGGWGLITDMSITANWDADSDNRWTIPLGGGVSRLVKAGKRPFLVRLEAYYNVERPPVAPDWAIHFTIRFLYPE